MNLAKTLKRTYWIIATMILLVPAIAMQFTDEVNWGVYDFLIMGALLVITGLAIEVVIRTTSKTRSRVALIFAIILVFLLVWAELAVGVLS